MDIRDIDNRTSMRIAILRSVMIFGIVILHTPDYVDIAAIGPHWFDQIKALFQHAVFRSSVPVLTFISGYLLFRKGLDRKAKDLAIKKLKSLGVPFLAFNFPLVVLAYAMQANFKFPISYQLYPAEVDTILDAALGLTTAPLNYPLHFLRDLFVLSLLAPVFGWLLRRAALIGLLIIAGLFIFNFESHLVLQRTMPIMFYIGGMAAIHNWNMNKLDRYATLCLTIFITLCVGIVAFKVSNITYFRLSATLLVWPATSLLIDTKLGDKLAKMSKYSFFIFLTHAPTLLATWMAYKQVKAIVPYELYWAVTPMITVAALIMVYEISMRYLPRAFSHLIGQRTTTSFRNRANPQQPYQEPIAVEKKSPVSYLNKAERKLISEEAHV